MDRKVAFEWPPLESDPKIFTKYFGEIGLDQIYKFSELLSLDFREVQFIEPETVFGVIVAVRRNKSALSEYFREENFLSYNDIPFYMKQSGSLDNACGLIAALHVVGNNRSRLIIGSDSILQDFYASCENASDEERSTILQNFEKFKERHESFASEGQSSVPTTQAAVKHHYVGFVNVNGNVIELDGTIKGPYVIKKNSLPENLLDDVCEEVKKRLELQLINEDLSVLIMGPLVE